MQSFVSTPMEIPAESANLPRTHHLPGSDVKRAAIILLGLLAVLLLLVMGAAACAWYTLPPRHETTAIPGLSAPVEIGFDADGVPRIRAATDMDAAAALGFAHARDRMFQMELMRRIGSGRLSEIAGPAGLNLDEFMRTLGLRHHAEADYPLLPAHTRALLEAYARGVNAYIAARGRLAAPEFLLLGRPEPWTPIDSMLWGKEMSLYLSGNYRTELAHLALGRLITPNRIDGLFASPPTALPTALATPLSPRAPRLAQNLLAALPRFPDRFMQPQTASNEWAVDAAHSATGAPLLAGDPHLALGLPGTWYLARIDTPDETLVGATAPGVPFLLIGHNRAIAWTFTTSGTDTEDLFVETPVDRDHYATPDGPAAYITHDEIIHVRGGADRVLHVRQTRHGPVISDIQPDTAQGDILALSMESLAPGDTAPGGIDALNQAKTLVAALATAPAITSPNQNLLVADAHDIGLAMTGRVPIRRTGDGETPVDGASGTYDWIGTASGTQLPHYRDPPSGRLVNGNERLAPADFPVFLGRDSYGDWRAQRIRALLDAHRHATVADFTGMQADVVSTYAQQLLPFVLQARPSTPLGNKALDLLRNWDGQMRRQWPQPLIFNAWLQRFALTLLNSAGVPNSDAGPRLEFVAAVLADNTDSWCNSDCIGLETQAFEQAVADLARAQGPNPATWRWGRAHRAIFAHPLLGPIPVLGRLTTRRIASSGDDSTVGRAGTANDAIVAFDDVHAAAYRGVYDLADLDRSRFMVAPGQSGNLFSPHVADFMRRWRDGQTILLGPSPNHIEQTVRLIPAAPATETKAATR